MRKKLKWIVWILFLFVGLTGCGGQAESAEKEMFLPASEELFHYNMPEEAASFAVAENGLLYTVRRISKQEESGENVGNQLFEVYDLSGNCITQTEVQFGKGPVTAMAISEGFLYCVTDKDLDKYVYRVNTATWEVTELTKLLGYQFINKVVLLGDYLYLLGTMDDVTKNYTLHPDVYFFFYQGEHICRIDVTKEKPEQERMRVDFPISMYVTEEDTLMVYQYTEEKGFGFLEFNPVALTLEEKEWSHGYGAKANLSNCGNGYVYTEEFKLYYGTIDGTSAQVLPDRIDLLISPVYQKGFLFYQDREQPEIIKRFCVMKQIRENKEIQVLSNEFVRDMPNSCGYRMSMHAVTAEEFALKVLAQDRDFDTYLLSTREDCAYNLKKNGAFYPLNEVEGVQEYLDACFPYVKELAYNEDGEIWMVPVGLAIPGIVYNKEFCEQNGVDYSKMDFQEFVSFLEQVETETPELTSMALIMLIEEFHMQYLSKYDSFDTDLTRDCLKRLREIYEKYGDWGANDVYGRSLADGTIADFYAEYNVYNSSVEILARAFGDSEVYGFTAVPRLSQNTKNVGTITLLAVNPQSDRLEDTLEYISVFCKYMLNKKDSFLLADETMYTDTPFIKDQYELYANGDVNFRMEFEVYLEDFGAYLRGEKELEETIREVERKRKIYVGE